MRLWRVVVGAVALLVAAAYGIAGAATFVSIKTGIGYDPSKYRIIRETRVVTAADWPVYTLVHFRNVRAGDRWEVRLIQPDGQIQWTWTHSSAAAYNNYYLYSLIPLLGTPNEERLGVWRVSVSHEGSTYSGELQVNGADPSALQAIRAEQAANPDDFDANYRLGAAASMFGEDQVAIESLRRAARIRPRSVYPHVALCRHFIRQKRAAEARTACATARGLLLGREDSWLRPEIDRMMQQIDSME